MAFAYRDAFRVLAEGSGARTEAGAYLNEAAWDSTRFDGLPNARVGLLLNRKPNATFGTNTPFTPDPAASFFGATGSFEAAGPMCGVATLANAYIDDGKCYSDPVTLTAGEVRWQPAGAPVGGYDWPEDPYPFTVVAVVFGSVRFPIVLRDDLAGLGFEPHGQSVSIDSGGAPWFYLP